MDIAPENVVFIDGQAAALIDFDLARPTHRVNEVCNLLLWRAPLMPIEDCEAAVHDVDAVERAAMIVDAYDLGPQDREWIVPMTRTWPIGHGTRCKTGRTFSAAAGDGCGTTVWATDPVPSELASRERPSATSRNHRYPVDVSEARAEIASSAPRRCGASAPDALIVTRIELLKSNAPQNTPMRRSAP